MPLKSPTKWAFRDCRIPPAAGERAVFGRPATSHSRYFQLPVLAVQEHWLYKRIDHILLPTENDREGLLRAHGYKAKLHVISNGYSPGVFAEKPADPDASAPCRSASSLPADWLARRSDYADQGGVDVPGTPAIFSW